MRFRSLLLSLALASTLHAQSFTPKAIRVEGIPAADQADVIAITGLKPGSMTKDEIETGLGKLVDTNDYKDISYTVGPEALVIKLTPLSTRAATPVRFSNFVWWDDAALEKMVEARVPTFHGTLKQATPLTEQVEAALIGIGKEKGVTINKVDLLPTSHGMALAIVSPQVLCGKLTVPEVRPLEGGTFQDFQQALYTQEFDKTETPGLVASDTEEIYGNAGYLDAKAGSPMFATPRMESGKYFIDITETVDRGEFYRVGTVSVEGADPKQIVNYDKRIKVVKGDAAAPLLFRETKDGLIGGLYNKGYLDATVSGESSMDHTSHTVNYVFHATPGALYHLARISVNGTLPSDVGPALQKDKRLTAGVVADGNVIVAAQQDLKDVNAQALATVSLKPSQDDHTASLVVTARRNAAN